MKAIALTTLFALTVIFSTKAAQDYEIRLHRPLKIGQKVITSVTGSDFSEKKAEVNGRNLPNERKEFDFEYEAEVTVLEVGKNGCTTKESHNVSKLVKITSGERKSMLQKGKIVTAFRKDKKIVFEIDGVPVDKELDDLLMLVIEINNGTTPTEDDIVGAKGRKKIGESWEANQSMLEKDFSKDGDIRVENPSGKFSLKEVGNDASGETLVVEGIIKAKGVVPSPPGMTIQVSTLTVTISSRVPTDTSLPRKQEHQVMEAKIIATGKPNPTGPEVQLSMVAKRTITRTLALAK